ncbi:MAG: Scr1 family TA system antitoxin-like transcriptional regulator [Pseudonocardiaceae bacterium]
MFGRECPARFIFFIHEFALRLPMGGPAVMAEQLEHLLHKATRPYLTLRVVPAALGGHAAINGSSRLMEFAKVATASPTVTVMTSIVMTQRHTTSARASRTSPASREAAAAKPW